MKENFKEDDIRPDHLKGDQLAFIEADILWLEKHSESFIDVKCPACNGDSPVETFRKRPHVYVTCKECGTLFVTPRPTVDLLASFYKQSQNYDYWNKYIFPESEAVRREKVFLPRVARLTEIVNRHGFSGGTLLEVGAGFGIFCEEIKRMDIFSRVIAVEPTPSLAKTCREKGLEVVEKPFEDTSLKEESVDIVAAFEVLEHLFDPKDFVEKCSTILKPGGLILITIPNWHGFDLRVLGPVSDTIDHEHLNYFTPNSISNMLEAYGFEVIEALTPGKLDAELVRKKVLDGAFDLSDNAFLEQVLIDEWARVGTAFQKFLSENSLSSHLWVVARFVN